MHPWKAFFVSFAVVTGAARVVHPHTKTAAPPLRVPLAAALPDLDGEIDEDIWRSAARTGAFHARRGEAARPFSEARFAWTKTHLLVALYAADEDIRTSGPARDVFRVTVGTTTFDVSATGALRGAPAGTRVGSDRDGTLDDGSDDDEEWGLEVAIPLESVGARGDVGERIVVRVERCETARGAARACGTTGVLDLVFEDAR